MTTQITLSGSMAITGDSCCSGSGQDTKQVALGVLGGGCTSQQYQADVGERVVLATTGTPGQVFQDVNSLDSLSEIFMLFVKSSAHIVLRLYAVPASAVASAGAYPTGFAGGETLITTIDGVAVTTTFTAGAQTLIQVANEINASMALAGIATPRASASNGQLRIDGVATAVNGAVGVLSFSGTGAAQLGMDVAGAPTITPAQGQDVDVYGLFIQEFPRTGSHAPTAAQISGTATVDIVAAGNS